MKMPHALLFVLALMAVGAAVTHADDRFNQTVSVPSAGSGVSTSVAGGKQWSIQCTMASSSVLAHYRACATSSCTATATDWVVPANGMDVPLDATLHFFAFFGEGGTGTCRIYEVVPQTIRTF